MAERDFLTEVRDAVEAYLDSHENGLQPGVAAAELGEEWEKVDPKLLRGWLMKRWQGVLADYISSVSRSRSARAHRERVHATFGEFADAFEGSETEEEQQRHYRHWLTFHEVTVEGVKTRKAMHRLTSPELAQVQASYEQRSADNAFYARVMGAIQKKVGRAGPNKTVGDVYTPEQLEAMFER